MRKLVIFFLLLITFSCSDNNNDPNNILPNVPVNETVFLNNPEYIHLRTSGAWAYTKGGISGIVIYHSGVNTYVAFERSAPHLTPQLCSKMEVKNSIVMFCSCDNSEFNILNGGPLTDGINVAARQYRVDLLGDNTLRITNY